MTQQLPQLRSRIPSTSIAKGTSNAFQNFTGNYVYAYMYQMPCERFSKVGGAEHQVAGFGQLFVQLSPGMPDDAVPTGLVTLPWYL